MQAAKLVGEVVAELDQRQQRDPNSLWLRSRRAWAEWFARGVRRDRLVGIDERPWPSEFSEVNCDPEEEIDGISNAANAEVRRQHEAFVSAIPLFEPGHYQDRSGTTRLQMAANVESIITLSMILETAGLPLRLQHASFAGEAARDSLEVAYQPSVRWYSSFIEAMNDPFDKQFTRFFGRLAVAHLPADVAQDLSEKATSAIFYWRAAAKRARHADGSEFTFAVNKIRLMVEVLARLTVRLSSDAAKASLELAAELARDATIMHLWLYDPLAHLVRYSCQAVAPRERSLLVLPMLEFPLSPDQGGHPFRWPSPIELLENIQPDRVESDARWAQCIAKLCEAVKPRSPQRPEAVAKLGYLARKGVLTEEEAKSFGRELWAEREDGGSALPSGTRLYSFAFIELPAPPEVDVGDIVRSWLFNCGIKEVLCSPNPAGTRDVQTKLNRIISIFGTAQVGLKPTHEQAACLFDDIVGWRPLESASEDSIRAAILQPLRSTAMRYLGEILRKVAVPSLGFADRTGERADALLAFSRTTNAGTAVGALPYFVADDNRRSDAIIARIHQAIAGRSEEEVAGGAMAIEVWATRTATGDISPLPPLLIDRVISAIENGREIGLLTVLECARKLVAAWALSESEQQRLASALGTLLNEWNYASIGLDSRQSVSVSLVRVGCMRLARKLQAAGISDDNTKAWLEAGLADPLPEVRFALEDEE